MKLLILLALQLVLLPWSHAQDIPVEDHSCREKCSYAHTGARLQQVSYYQYTSMNKYDVKYLKLDLAAEAGSYYLSGTALTVVKVLQPLDSFVTELKSNMAVDSVFINGMKMNFDQGSDHVFIPLPAALPVGSLVTALFYYNGTTNAGAVFAGTMGSTGLTYTATLSESYQAREWFPAKQVLSDKIDSADIWIKTSAGNKVGSNGLLVAVADSPGNKKQYQWRSRYPMNYYMPSFSIGNYREYLNYAKPTAMAPDSILIQHYIADDNAYFLSVKNNLDKTPAFIEKFSELFGLYPFSNEKYGHAQASIGGGMEHQTMSTMNSFGSTLIAHELAHQWWGDQITCATWNHIWLNEGFASYCEYLAIENLPALFPTTNPAAYMQGFHNSAMSQPGGSVYVPDASLFDENRIFSSRLSYNKGAAIIHNLRFEIQDDNLFFQVLKNYQQLYKNSVATADDFKMVAEAISGKNLADFFNQWYYGEGYPTFNITYIKQGNDSIILSINETVSAAAVTPFFKGLYEFKITSLQGDTIVKAYVTSNNQVFKFKYSKNPSGIVVDPNNWVLNATGAITNGGVIPVKLLSFEASTKNNCSVVLRWKTTNEQNSRSYEVEYSNNGTDFRKAGVLQSHNSSYESDYEFNYDPGVQNLHYYFRLKMIDEGGNYAYSQVVVVSKNCSTSLINISPNPVAELLNISIDQASASQTTIQIFNSTGALIYKNSKLLNAGSNLIVIDKVKNFAPGTYLLRIGHTGETIQQPFIKL